MKNFINNPTKTISYLFNNFRRGTLDLKTAFWGFGFFGSIISAVIFITIGSIFESQGMVKFFIFLMLVVNFLIVLKLIRCADHYKKEMDKKKKSDEGVIWGTLAQIYGVVLCFIYGGILFSL